MNSSAKEYAWNHMQLEKNQWPSSCVFYEMMPHVRQKSVSPPADLPHPRIKQGSPELQADSSPAELQRMYVRHCNSLK